MSQVRYISEDLELVLVLYFSVDRYSVPIIEIDRSEDVRRNPGIPQYVHCHLDSRASPWTYPNMYWLIFRYLGALPPSTGLFTHYVACTLYGMTPDEKVVVKCFFYNWETHLLIS